MPGYAVPAAVLVHAALPLTVNGKLDIAAMARVPIPEGSVGDERVPDPITALLAATALPDAFAEVIPIRGQGRAEPLFCVHGGMGLALPYLGLAGTVEERAIIGLQSHAVDPVVALPDSIHAVAETYLDTVERMQPDGPLHLLGWSYGGLVAQEMAALAMARGRSIGWIGLVDAYPALPDSGTDDDRDRASLLASAARYLGLVEDGDACPADVDALRALLAQKGSALSSLEPERIERLIELIERHAEHVAVFEPRILAADVDLFLADAAGEPPLRARRRAWAPFVTGKLRSFPITAAHDFLMHPEPQREIGELIDRRLRDRAQLRASALTPPDPDHPGVRMSESVLTHIDASAPGSGSTAGRAHVLRPRSVADSVAEITALVSRRMVHVAVAPGRLVGIVMNPLVILIAVGYLFAGAVSTPGGGAYVDYLFGGVILQVGLASIGPTATSVNIDLARGLMDRFRSLPISRMGVLVAHSLADLLIGLGALAVVASVALLIGWRPTSSPLEIAAGFGVAALFVYACVWLGILLGVVVKNVESIESIGSLVLVVLSFLSNAILAPAGLPDWLRPVAEWNPVSIVADLCRSLWGNPLSGAVGVMAEYPGWIALGTFALVIGVAVLLGGRRFRRGA